MDVLDTVSWATRASALAAQLDAELGAGGVVLDPAWRHAFAVTPRHHFVPRILNDGTVIGRGDPGWLDAVYANEALATQSRPCDTSGRAIPSSSSSKPTIMARMLARLAVTSGHRVLEIGMGARGRRATTDFRDCRFGLAGRSGVAVVSDENAWPSQPVKETPSAVSQCVVMAAAPRAGRSSSRVSPIMAVTVVARPAESDPLRDIPL